MAVSEIRVGAEIEIAFQDEKAVHTKPIFSTAKGPNPEARVRLPGPREAFITLIGLDPGAKTIHLDYEGPLPNVKEETIAKPPSMIVEVAVKPGMTILWFGVFLVLLGGCMGVARRFSI